MSHIYKYHDMIMMRLTLRKHWPKNVQDGLKQQGAFWAKFKPFFLYFLVINVRLKAALMYFIKKHLI